MDFKRILKNLDWWLIAAVLILMGCGLGLIDSATHSFAVSTGKAWHVQRQSMFMLFGLAVVTASLAFVTFVFFTSTRHFFIQILY